MTSTTIRRRDAAASTARLLEAASAEFAARGFDGARVDRIATRSQTNRAIMFQRFGDKSGLYRAVLDHVATAAAGVRARLAEAHQEPPADAAQFRDHLGELARVNLQFLREHPDAGRILAWERAAGRPIFQSVSPGIDDPAAATITEWFRVAARQGWLRRAVSPERQLALTFELAASLTDHDQAFAVAVITDALSPRTVCP